MAAMTKAMKIQFEIETLRRFITDTEDRIEELDAKLKALTTPPAPPPGSWLTVEVKFHSSPHWYRYLILHVPTKGYYTTGSMEENKFFPTWKDLIEYFNKDDVEKRSPFHTVELIGDAYGGSIVRSNYDGI